MMRFAAIAALPVLCVMLGCAHVQPAPIPPTPAAAPSPGASPSPAAAPAAADQPAPAANPATPAAAPPDTTPPPSTNSGDNGPAPAQPASAAPARPSATSQAASAAKPKPPAASKSSSAAPAASVAAPAVKTPATDAPPPPPQAPALDLASLEQRLRDTRAIGVFTKLSLKNQVDQLLGQFKDFHGGKLPPALPELRQRYDLLLMKVLSLLQDGDPSLAKAISGSREAIWGILSDPQKFSKI
jgi:hypothetical protein